MILAIRTDKPEAELYLFDGQKQVAITQWHAHRELSNTLLDRIELLLKDAGIDKTNLTAIIVYKGPGSFTGLRIGITVANTMAYSLRIPIVAASGNDELWYENSIQMLLHKAPQKNIAIMPHYGAEVRITAPKK